MIRITGKSNAMVTMIGASNVLKDEGYNFVNNIK